MAALRCAPPNRIDAPVLAPADAAVGEYALELLDLPRLLSSTP